MNDNLYKLLLVYLLISIKGPEHSNTILSLAGAIFVIPFLLFASFSGTLADRYSKRTIIYFTRLLEIFIMILGVFAFLYQTALGGYIVLFLLAFHSTLFSPCKYGILPEIAKKEKLSHYNGILTATTYMAIISGTFLASFLTDITHKNFILCGIVCVVIALLAGLSSLGIGKTWPQAADKKLSVRFISSIYYSLKKAKKVRYLLHTILFGSYFLFIGAYTQLNIIPYTMQSLALPEVYGGYLFLMTAMGIGIGSFLAGHFSGKEIELGFIPLATFGVSFCFMTLYLFEGHLSIVIASLFLIGVFGGFYTVPIDAFIQAASPNEDRGQNVATSNFVNFLGVIVAAALLALFGNIFLMSASRGFFMMGWIALFLALLLVLLFLDQILRLIVAKVGKAYWNIHVEGHRAVHQPTLFIGTRQSWLDTLIVMTILPRLMRTIVPIRRESRVRKMLYRLLHFIPLDISSFSPLKELAVETIRTELLQGHSLCLMQPVDHTVLSLEEWEKILDKYLPAMNIPIIPIYISREAAPTKEHSFRAIKRLFTGKIVVHFGN